MQFRDYTAATVNIKSIFICLFKQQQRRFDIGYYNSMKKYSYFQCSAHLSQLQARLEKNGYLSKGSLPNGADAKVFLVFERLRKIPQRAIHPNLYHWYILMKQFSLRTVEIWQQQVVNCEYDTFISQYAAQEIQSAQKENNLALNYSDHQQFSYKKPFKNLPFLSTPKNVAKSLDHQGINENLTKRPNLHPTSLRLIPTEGTSLNNLSKGQLCSPAYEKQYVMQMQLKQSTRRMHGLKQRLQSQKIQLINLEVEQGSIRVVFRAQPQQYEKLKDRISQWEEISNLRFRKEKRFNIKKENKSEKIILSNDVCVATPN